MSLSESLCALFLILLCLDCTCLRLCAPPGASTEEAQLKVAHDIAFQIADGLEKGNWVGVCNAAHVAAASTPAWKPYVAVAESIGSLQGQIHDGNIVNVEVTTTGKILGSPEAQVWTPQTLML